MDKMIRDEWRNTIVSTEAWNLHLDAARPANPGEAGGFYVKSVQSGLVAYLKPLKIETDAKHRRAAYEKIASDLAYELDFNVPPLVLYVRADAPDNESKETALSLLVGSQIFEWNELCDLSSPDGGFVQKRALLQIVKFVFYAAAEVVALDAWLGNQDRNNHRNAIVVCEENTLGSLYFLDYSYSMDFNGAWSRGNHLQFSKVAIPPAFAHSLRKDRVRLGAEKIFGIPDQTVETIVKRIPDQFLAQEQRDNLFDCLIARKSKLLDEFDAWYPGV